MKTIQARIDEQVDALISNLNALVAEAAQEAIARRSGQKQAGTKRGRRAEHRRTPEEVTALAEEVYAQICDSPGETVQTLSATMGRASSELALPMCKLVGAGRVKKTGQRQFTRYFPIGQQAKRRRRKSR